MAKKKKTRAPGGSRPRKKAAPGTRTPAVAASKPEEMLRIAVSFRRVSDQLGSAGNGHVAFPGMMRSVISAGGVFIDQAGEMWASDYASSFTSHIYPGRSVPDACGLVGMSPGARYIMLPIPPRCEIDAQGSPADGTAKNDDWATFSGTSAAAPQIAGVCALLLQKDPTLTPAQIKAILMSSARDVDQGAANPASNVGVPRQATSGSDGATGGGLVDAFAALRPLSRAQDPIHLGGW